MTDVWNLAPLIPNIDLTAAKLGQYQNAINDYTKAIQLDPDYAMPYAALAWAYYYTPQYTNQKADEAKACSLDSKYC